MHTAASQNDKDGLIQEIQDWQSLQALCSCLLQATTLGEQVKLVLETGAAFHHCEQGLISLFDRNAGGLVTVASLGISEEGLKQLACIAVADSRIAV